MSGVNDMVLPRTARIDPIAEYLDSIDPTLRAREVLALSAPAIRRLWELASGRAVSLDDLVPAARGPHETVRHLGRNTLPALSRFEKRLCRPRAASEPILWGYNESRARALVGPGCFVARPTPEDPRGAAVIDYHRIPDERPPGWPRLAPNDRGVAQFVYGFTHDFLRRVSEGVVVGLAFRHDRRTANGFVLCRAD